MTNREWLFEMTDKELAEFLCSEDFQCLKMAYTHSALGIEQWLALTRNTNK